MKVGSLPHLERGRSPDTCPIIDLKKTRQPSHFILNWLVFYGILWNPGFLSDIQPRRPAGVSPSTSHGSHRLRCLGRLGWNPKLIWEYEKVYNMYVYISLSLPLSLSLRVCVCMCVCIYLIGYMFSNWLEKLSNWQFFATYAITPQKWDKPRNFWGGSRSHGWGSLTASSKRVSPPRWSWPCDAGRRRAFSFCCGGARPLRWCEVGWCRHWFW